VQRAGLRQSDPEMAERTESQPAGALLRPPFPSFLKKRASEALIAPKKPPQAANQKNPISWAFFLGPKFPNRSDDPELLQAGSAISQPMTGGLTVS
jgi:hypothetical protein